MFVRFGIAMVAVAVVSVALGGRIALAQSSDERTRSAARKLGYEGVEAFEAGDFRTASDKLERAYAVLHAPSLGLWSARALVKQSKLRQAVDRYREVASLPLVGAELAVQKQAQADAQQELLATQKTIPMVVVSVEGAPPASVSLTIDAVPVPIEKLGTPLGLDPGTHLIAASSGQRQGSAHVTLAENQQQKVALVLALDPSARIKTADQSLAPPSTSHSEVSSTGSESRRTWGWVALGAGGAGLVVGGVATALAVSKKGSLDENPGCSDRVCPRNLSDDVNGYNQWRTVSTIGFIAGGVFVATGATLLLTSPRAERRAALFVSPAAVELRGRF